MRSCWRLLALALALASVFSFSVYPAEAGISGISGIFDNRASFGDLDDDFDEMLRRLRPPAATAPSAAVDASASPILRLSVVLTGAELMSWTARPPADRGPPGGHTSQHVGPSPSPASFQPAFPCSHQSSCPLTAPTQQSPMAHPLRSERTITWQR